MFPIALVMSVLAPAVPQTVSDGVPSLRKIEAKREVAARVTHFTRTLRVAGLPGTVLTCENLVELSDARFPTTHSYGGICSLSFQGRKREYAICDTEDSLPGADDDAGLAALGLSYDTNNDWIVDFTRNNCS